MNKAGWNPVRKNRNIGTKASGYSKNNALLIPQSNALKDEYKSFYEDLNNPVRLSLDIHGHSILLLVEPTYKGYAHACTPMDIAAILHLLPKEHTTHIDTIVLRQPKKKEQILSSVWGRLIYWGDYQENYGPTIILEAQLLPFNEKWSHSLTPFLQKELDALESDGHKITRNKRDITISGSLGTVRNTQLYRTLPHELGHLVDYHQSYQSKVNGLSEREEEQLSDIYFSKPKLDKEEFANRYARDFMKKHSDTGEIPFARLFEAERIKSFGLELAWFSQ